MQDFVDILEHLDKGVIQKYGRIVLLGIKGIWGRRKWVGQRKVFIGL